jgi:hypothetical protein
MADKKISALTGATTPLAGTEVLPIVQGGATVNVSVANLTAGRAVAMAGGSFTDNITQGTAAKGFNFTANTNAAGMTSELLNWYEEGTWTPALVSTGATFTYAQQVGRYTRIGRQVTCEFRIFVSASGTVTNTMQMTGLPFTSNATTNVHGTVVCGYSSFVDGFPTAYVNTNATTFDLNNPAGVASTPTSSGLNTTSKYYIGTAIYFT